MTEFFSSHGTLFGVMTIVSCMIAIGACVVALLCVRRVAAMQNKLSQLLAGTKARDLEDVITHNNTKIADFDGDIHDLFNASNTIHRQAHKGLHKVGLIRFNPFRDNSGNQSFALALLNSKNNGIVLSSIHTREGTRVYAKDVRGGNAHNHELTQEEKTAITQAQ